MAVESRTSPTERPNPKLDKSPERFSTVGKPEPRIDGGYKVSGKAIYTADRALDRIAWGKAVRSPYPHARIRRIDASRARNCPGVLAIVTAADVSNRLFGRQLRDMPILAGERVRFAGEKVAAVAADNPEAAEAAALSIEVDYEELPAVFDPLEAMQEASPIIHEGLAAYPNAPRPLPPFPNVHSHVQWRLGDCEAGFAESDFVFEQTFTTQRVHQAYLEPHACLVSPGPGDRISIWSTNKVPFQTKQYLAEVLGVDPAKLLFQLGPVGGDFGGKGSLMDLPLAYYLARLSGRPVKMVMNYNEELTAGNPRHPSTIRIKTGVKKDGRLWARQVTIVFNSGAYAAFKPNATVNLPGARHGAGAYRIPNVLVQALSVYTNCAPSGHMRGPGDPQVYFAVESHTDYIARQLNMDPLEFRRMNVGTRGDSLACGDKIESDRGTVLLDAIAARRRRPIGTSKPGRRLLGRGIALGLRDIGPGEANVEVGLKPDGSLYLLTTVTDTGAGAHTTLRQIVAEVFRIPSAAVDIVVGDTDSFDTDIALGGSRVNYMAGRAAAMAALDLCESLKNIAAEKWDCPPDSIKVAQSLLHGPAGKKISFSELAQTAAAKGLTLKRLGHFVANGRAGTLSFFAQEAEVEVDPQTGQLAVLRVRAANDVGAIINPVIHQGQIDGGVIQGLGFAVMEHLRDTDGRIALTNLSDYKIPTIADIPRLETLNIPDSTGPGPFLSKPIGESTVTLTAAAIANAVYDAIGVQITDLPLTSEKIYYAIQPQE
ncbi:MAG TPA: xanthine dehydrogenase family protein molybdopterin-binding subunit [Candidatus Eisenbacteria bacterium]|nr:xanthine dehydrogenase family protein molybdopterin-binding subunit [Candidatus Eisenbacteria bacterium]